MGYFFLHLGSRHCLILCSIPSVQPLISQSILMLKRLMSCLNISFSMLNSFLLIHRDSHSFSFLLPFGFVTGAFIPAIFALYFALRGSLYVQLQNRPLAGKSQAWFHLQCSRSIGCQCSEKNTIPTRERQKAPIALRTFKTTPYRKLENSRLGDLPKKTTSAKLLSSPQFCFSKNIFTTIHSRSRACKVCSVRTLMKRTKRGNQIPNPMCNQQASDTHQTYLTWQVLSLN